MKNGLQCEEDDDYNSGKDNAKSSITLHWVLCAKSWAFSFQWLCQFNEMTAECSIYHCSHFVVLYTQSHTANINRRKGTQAVCIQNP